MKSRLRAPDTGDLWRFTMEHSPVGMTLVSLEGDFLTANGALCEMLGYDLDALVAMTFQDLTHPDDLELDLRLLGETIAGTINSYRITKRYVRQDGSILVGDLSVVLLRDELGAPMYFISQIVDLSERRAFEARLESAEQQIEIERRRVEAVFDTVAVGLLLLDADGNYQTYNSRHQDLMDLAFPTGHAGVAGQDGFVFDADQQRTLTRAEMPSIRAASGEEFQDLLIWIGEEPMTRRALSISARPVRDETGAFTGAALAYQDVTQLMRAMQVKDEFVASISHELRTPLTSALAYLELLDGAEGLDDDVRSQIVAVRRNAMRLSRLVADLIFVSTATAGAQLIDRFRVDLALVVGEAVDAARLQAESAGVTLVRELPETLTVLVDGLRLRQAADNLITNAITYTPAGGEVRVALAAGDAVELVVADTGEGIDEEDLDRLFAKFVRGTNARRRLIPGTGLGLNVVRTIVEAHGGRVSMESAVGVGTTVRVVLPR